MSWYLANKDGIIDQFASISGLADLRNAAADYPALKGFFEVGATKNILLCIDQLDALAKNTKDRSVKDTAKGLAAIMRGQTTVWITQGVTEYENHDEIEFESGDPLKYREPVKPTTPTVRKSRKKAARSLGLRRVD